MLKQSSILFAAVFSVTPLHAEIYKYRDAEGNVCFSDRPMKDGYRLEWRSSKYDWPSSNRSAVTATTARTGWDPALYRLNRGKYTPLIEEAAKEVRLRPELLHAVVEVESGYNPTAVSRAGAVGLMQLMPDTAQRFGVGNSEDPGQNINGGARYLRELLELFSFDLQLALAGYNAGENAVIKNGYAIPPFPETERYVKKVLDLYMKNRIETATTATTASREGN